VTEAERRILDRKLTALARRIERLERERRPEIFGRRRR